MFVRPDFDPIALSVGPLSVYWYGVMYLASFLVGWALANARTRLAHIEWSREQVGDFLFYVVLGVVLGGRLGYVLLYQPGAYFAHPLHILYVWDGGMSFHGGLIGVAAASLLFAWRGQRHWFDVIDFVAPIVPIGLFLGRIGNFINGELVGRIVHTPVPWAMVYPQVGPNPRHPSELYEACLEGLLLFVLLWFFALRPRPRGVVTGVFLTGYGCARFVAEFFRQPDPFAGFVAFGWMTLGQVYSLPMIAIGVALMIWGYTRRPGIA
ncbi:prolipoprotein diacylglyceryl transferase [Salinisphaera sp. USBA-960]|uniref:prolipoprotein diacylglyceryl transferase n=1 Tax=Salinisphaera orenii TaxID=856731 RepID=UPI000DBE5604|nr:prolipoprotein diacylglyceryl transferase [Salifodinibacter halophilus]NNC26443.1 prolipoprotein diacylglyceryl transferase [Salifodinibacter halophilus]